MKVYFKLSLILLGLTVFLSSCKALQDLADAQKPNLSVKNVRVTNFAFDEIELTFDVNVENPNPFALHLLSYDYGFNINGNSFVQGTQEEGLSIDASQTSTIHIPVQLNFVELYNLFGSFKGEDEADYTLATDLTFNLPVLGATTIPLKKTGTIPLIKLPKISVSGLEIKEMGLSGVDLALHLNLKNPNAFGLILNMLSYDLQVNGETLATSTFTEQVKASSNGATNITIPISLNTLKIGASVIKLLRNSNDVHYQLKGSIDMGTTHPLLKETIFNFLESGDLPVNMH